MSLPKNDFFQNQKPTNGLLLDAGDQNYRVWRRKTAAIWKTTKNVNFLDFSWKVEMKSQISI